MKESPVQLSVVMACYNRSNDILRTLAAYDAQSTPALFEVVAVDDCSGDGTYETLCTYQPRHYVLRAERLAQNAGAGAARNRALQLATGAIVVFVGDDIVPEKNFIQGHLAAHRRYPETEQAILGQTVWPADLPQNTLMRHIQGPGAQQFSYFFLKNRAEYDFRHFYTSNVSIKRAMLDRAPEGFDPVFRHAFEDPELAYRLSKFGLRIRYLSSIRAAHYHYHTIWSFVRRQMHNGRMVWPFIRKHRAVAKYLLPQGRGTLFGLLGAVPRPLTSAQTQRLEERALFLASFYEWTPQPLLDWYYIHLLNYFYYKGLLEALFPAPARQAWAINAHARAHLLPLLQQFLQRGPLLSVPMPSGYHPHLLKGILLQDAA